MFESSCFIRLLHRIPIVTRSRQKYLIEFPISYLIRIGWNEVQGRIQNPVKHLTWSFL